MPLDNTNLVAIVALLIGLIVGGLILWIIFRQKVNLLEEKIEFTKDSYSALIENQKESLSKLEEDLNKSIEDEKNAKR